MFLLIRRISEYTAPHVLLGVFLTAEGAEAAKVTYAQRYAVDPASDPWREQAYKEFGLSKADLVVYEFACPRHEVGAVHVVSDYAEGFGQISREFDSLHATADAAIARAAELDAAESRFPHYALVQQVEVNVLLSDVPGQQPRLR